MTGNEPNMELRKPPSEWEDSDWLIVSMALEEFAEAEIEGNPRVEDVLEMANDGYAVRATQLRDGVADYLGIQPGEHEEQLR